MWAIDGTTTHPVGKKQANGYGFYDMSGNVGELTENADDPHRRHTIRGGQWSDGEVLIMNSPAFRDSRIAINESADADTRRSEYGFRLARTRP